MFQLIYVGIYIASRSCSVLSGVFLFCRERLLQVYSLITWLDFADAERTICYSLHLLSSVDGAPGPRATCVGSRKTPTKQHPQRGIREVKAIMLGSKLPSYSTSSLAMSSSSQVPPSYPSENTPPTAEMEDAPVDSVRLVSSFPSFPVVPGIRSILFC